MTRHHVIPSLSRNNFFSRASSKDDAVNRMGLGHYSIFFSHTLVATAPPKRTRYTTTPASSDVAITDLANAKYPANAQGIGDAGVAHKPVPDQAEEQDHEMK